MKEINFGCDKEKLIRAIENKGKAEGFKSVSADNEIAIGFDSSNPKAENFFPVYFKGRIESTDIGCKVIGKFSYGKFLFVIGAIVYVLIIARLITSICLMNLNGKFDPVQQKNMFIALGALAIAIAVTIFLVFRIKKSKTAMMDFVDKLRT